MPFLDGSERSGLPEGQSGFIRIEKGIVLVDAYELVAAPEQLLRDLHLYFPYHLQRNRDPTSVYTGQLEVKDDSVFVIPDVIIPLDNHERMIQQIARNLSIPVLREKYPHYRINLPTGDGQTINLRLFAHKLK